MENVKNEDDSSTQHHNFDVEWSDNKEMYNDSDTDTIRCRLKNIMYLACYCGLCTKKHNDLTSVYTPFEIGSLGTTTVLKMLRGVFHDTADILASYFICNQCLDKTLQSYIFIQNTKQSAKIMSEYINSFHSKVTTLEEKIDENVDYSETKFVILIEPNESSVYNANIKNVVHLQQTSARKDEPLGMLPDPIPETIIHLEDDKVTLIKTRNNAFKCSICDVVMVTFKNWKKHEQAYHKVDRNMPMTCQICFKVIANKRCLMQHYKKHNRRRCRHCNGMVSNPNFKSHMMDKHSIELKEQKIVTHEEPENVDENQCVMCFKRFNDQEQLNMHQCRFKCTECPDFICIHHRYLISFRQQAMNKSTKFVCPDCNYVCTKRDRLIGHANKEHLNYHYECDLCGAEYYSKSSLKFHTISAHGEQYVCKYCDEEFKDEVDYQIHIQVCKNEKRDIECSSCKASFSTQEELNRHEDLRHKMFPCGMCNKTFTTETKQREHSTKTHSGLERLKKRPDNLQCPICDRKFDLRGEYTKHLTTHGPIYNCKHCDQQYDNRKYFLRHYLHEHKYKTRELAEWQKSKVNKEKLALICATCGKVFNSRERFSAHRRAHMEPVCCEICNKMVKQISIYSHMRCHEEQMGLRPKRVTIPVKKYQCDRCDFKALTRQNIDTHINRVHLKVKPYKCEVCGVEYFSKSQLKEHVDSNHFEEKWQKCEICDKVIRTKRNLKKHMMRHAGEKPHVCDVCGHGFITKWQLTDHSVQHTEGKNIECPICESQFFSMRYLRQHIKKVHWKDDKKAFDYRLIKGLEGHEYIFQDKRMAVVE